MPFIIQVNYTNYQMLDSKQSLTNLQARDKGITEIGMVIF